LNAEPPNALDELIKTKIASQGTISFADFMEQALYARGLGYYVAGKHKFGAPGDFVTAPEISPLFSHALARQCMQVLHEIPNASILEVGAGSGKMALDILLYLESQDCLPEHYFILELSPDLKAFQKETLVTKAPHLQQRISWLQQLPLSLKGIILANEVMDALPVHCFCWTGETFLERCVTYDAVQNHFAWQDSIIPKDSMLELALGHLPREAFSKNYRSEINLFLPAWIASLSDTLDQGLILLLDYGFPQKEFYHPERTQGTLMCHYQHKAHADPFLHIGHQDITAHVDFTSVAKAAKAAHLTVAGYTNQANFLLNAGILEAFEKQIPLAAGLPSIQLQQSLRRLIEPHEMGELFKCMALTRDIKGPLIGFETGDRRETLHRL
jgi:SAM-dependent MidA family methyltransferase